MIKEAEPAGRSDAGRDSRLTLQAVGLTLLGVLSSIGVTVGSAIAAAWWIQIAAGVATTVGLAFAVALLGTRTRLLTRLADWITGRSYRESHGGDLTE